ncbi:MAG TPA: hypothetical protein DIW64_14675 [Cellvibrio sp.]|nr:hypothetical protein [Cellvibrio sp.]
MLQTDSGFDVCGAESHDSVVPVLSDIVSEPIVLNLLSPNWGTWDGLLNLTQNSNSLVAAFSSADLYKYLYYTYTGPVNLNGATLTVVLSFDRAAAASSKKVAFFNTLGDSWCFVNDGLDDDDIGLDMTYSCSDFTHAAAQGQTFKIGLVFAASAGSVTIKSATLQLAQ